jgi:hypothetical protein
VLPTNVNAWPGRPREGLMYVRSLRVHAIISQHARQLFTYSRTGQYRPQLPGPEFRSFVLGPEDFLLVLDRYTQVFERLVMDPRPVEGKRGQTVSLREFAGSLRGWIAEGKPERTIPLE